MGQVSKLRRRGHEIRKSKVICGFTELQFDWLNLV
jgi:hypothetical protein